MPEEEKAEVVEYKVKKRQNEDWRERRSSKQESTWGKDEEKEKLKKTKQKHKDFLLHVQIAKAIAYVPVVKSNVDRVC